MNSRAKRHEGKFRYFKALKTERDADNGAAQYHTVDCGAYCQRDTADEYPNDIRYDRRGAPSILYFFAERGKRQ